MKKQIKEILHHDVFGYKLELDSPVVIGRRNGLVVCKIKAMHPKQIRAVPLGSTYPSNGYLIYPRECMIISEDEVTMYLLKKVK